MESHAYAADVTDEHILPIDVVVDVLLDLTVQKAEQLRRLEAYRNGKFEAALAAVEYWAAAQQ